VNQQFGSGIRLAVDPFRGSSFIFHGKCGLEKVDSFDFRQGLAIRLRLYSPA